MGGFVLRDRHGISDALHDLGFEVIGIEAPGDGAYRIRVKALPEKVLPQLRRLVCGAECGQEAETEREK